MVRDSIRMALGIILLILLLAGGVSAVPMVEWNRTFGAKGNDYTETGQQTADSGYIIAGWTTSYGEGKSDAWLIKTDENGNKMWEKTFGGNENDVARSVLQIEDNRYIITGCTYSYGAGGTDAWLIETDANGNKKWEKTYGGMEDDFAYSVLQTEDNGYIIVGKTSSYGEGKGDAWLIKTDANGNKIWEKTYGGTEEDGFARIKQIKDGIYIITGWTSSYGEGKNDIWLIKIDANGNKIWEKTYGGSEDDFPGSVIGIEDDNFIIAGCTTSYGEGKSDIWLIKTDENGNKMWEKTFGGAEDECGGIQQTEDKGYIITGYTYGAGSSDAWLVKLSSEGMPTSTPMPIAAKVTPRTPGFEAVFALAGIVTIVYIMRREDQCIDTKGGGGK
jgi:hypothetical protein